MKWKENHDNDYYIKCFNEQVLSKLSAIDVVLDFSRLSYGFNIGENDICLICYEKPSDFCHRHLVADWLNKNGFRCDTCTITVLAETMDSCCQTRSKMFISATNPEKPGRPRLAKPAIT